MSTYGIALEKVGPNNYIGWTRWGSYSVGISGRDGKWIATFHRRSQASPDQYQLLGRFDELRDAKNAVQTYAVAAHRTGQP